MAQQSNVIKRKKLKERKHSFYHPQPVGSLPSSTHPIYNDPLMIELTIIESFCIQKTSGKSFSNCGDS